MGAYARGEADGISGLTIQKMGNNKNSGKTNIGTNSIEKMGEMYRILGDLSV